MSTDIELIDGVESVLSLGNLDDGKLIDEFENAYDWVYNHPIYSQGLVSKNGEMGSIIINLDDGINNHDLREITIREIEYIGFELLLLMFLSVWECDSAAFFFGKLFGKKKRNFYNS